MQHETMGDLPGHVFPGLALLAWALVWCLAVARRGGPAVLQPWSVAPDTTLAADAAAAAPWESWAKIVVPLLEMTGELRWVTWPMTEASATIYAHILMDVAFILSGVTDLLTARRRIAPHSDRIALALAFLVAGLLFGAHGQHGAVANAAHGAFAMLLTAAGVLIVVEHARPAPLIRWLRVYAVALAGAWFIHTGWMLYVAGYDREGAALVPRAYLALAVYAVALAVALLVALTLARGRRGAPPSADAW
ncbi:MAG: DUF716 domain-containing protein [Gemmatimonadota bacterium]